MDIKIKNIDTGAFFEFDNSNFILNNHNLNTFNIQHNTSKTIKQVGEYIQSTNVDSRPITLIGYIIPKSESDFIERKSLLTNITSPFSNIEIIANNKYMISGKCTKPVLWANGWENNNNKFVKFSLEFLCPNTLWYELEKTNVDLSPFLDTFIFPISITDNFSFGHREPHKITDIYNPINVSLPLEITLTCTGKIVNPEITRIQGNEKFLINTTMEAGDTIVINTAFAQKSVTQNGENIIGTVDLLNSKWLMLLAGLNQFGFNCKNSDKLAELNVTITYHQAYWGVNEW